MGAFSTRRVFRKAIWFTLWYKNLVSERRKEISEERVTERNHQEHEAPSVVWCYAIPCHVRASLPRRAALSMMRGLGGAAFYLLKSKRMRALKHLTAAFGREKSASEIHRIARQAFSNFGAFCADALLIPRIMGNGIDDLITAEGLERLDRLSRNNQGAILLTAHFGNWELLGAWLAERGYKVKAIGAPHSNPWINRMIADARGRAGYHSIGGATTRGKS